MKKKIETWSLHIKQYKTVKVEGNLWERIKKAYSMVVKKELLIWEWIRP